MVNPIAAQIPEINIADSLRKNIKPTQEIAPITGTTGYNGTLKNRLVSDSDRLSFSTERFTKRYVNRLPKFTIDAIVSILL